MGCWKEKGTEIKPFQTSDKYQRSDTFDNWVLHGSTKSDTVFKRFVPINGTLNPSTISNYRLICDRRENEANFAFSSCCYSFLHKSIASLDAAVWCGSLRWLIATIITLMRQYIVRRCDWIDWSRSNSNSNWFNVYIRTHTHMHTASSQSRDTHQKSLCKTSERENLTRPQLTPTLPALCEKTSLSAPLLKGHASTHPFPNGITHTHTQRLTRISNGN